MASRFKDQVDLNNRFLFFPVSPVNKTRGIQQCTGVLHLLHPTLFSKENSIVSQWLNFIIN